MDRESIIESACQLFLELGIKTTTMDDIAQKTGVSKKTLYIHFKNKADLIRSSVFHVSAKLNNKVTELVSESNNPIEQLYRIEEFFSCQEISKKASLQKQLRKLYPKIYKELQDKQLIKAGHLILTNLKKGIEDGYYRKEINLDFTMRLYMHIMFEAGNELPFLTGVFDHDFIGQTYLEYHTRAIATPKGLDALANVLKNKTVK